MNNWTRKNDGKNDNDIREQISENGVSILYFQNLLTQIRSIMVFLQDLEG